MNLSPNKFPLYLLDVLSLDEIGTPEARDAIDIRMKAFHEAGHVFAAQHFLLSLGPASIYKSHWPYRVPSEQGRAWLAAGGYVAQGLALEADAWLYGGDLLPTDPAQIDPIQVWEHITGLVSDDPDGLDSCRRGGDLAGAAVLSSERSTTDQADMFIKSWPRIEALAVRLMHGGVVPAREIAMHLSRA